jgi:CRP-like cAMP-binding protein
MFRQHRSEKIVFLEGSPLFRDLPIQQLRLVERHADLLAVPAGVAVAQPRLNPREFVAVHEGTLSVQSEGGATTLRAGDCFGALALLARRPRTATVVAETPATLVVIEARAFAYLMEAAPALHRRVTARVLQGLEHPQAG